jgi:two-component system sensor histidine kinase KdpD
MTRRLRFTPALLRNSALAVLLVALTTFLLLLIGRRQLGEGVIALVFLVPVIWSGYRWGQGPGMAAALVAALCFDFFFIPPFYTLTVGSLEGWLVLAIFLLVAVVLVGRFEASLSNAREMTYLYELTSALADAHTHQAVARTTARHIHQLYQAALVRVFVHPRAGEPAELVASEPESGQAEGKPDRQIPVLRDAWLVGEVQIWRGDFGQLPPEDSPFLQHVAAEVARALGRTRPEDAGTPTEGHTSISTLEG